MTNLHRLRLACERHYARVRRAHPTRIPNLHAFLVLPLKERLVLLCLADRANHKTIQAALPFAKQSDVRLTSPAMRAAIHLLRLSFRPETLA
jgi:hypothetical protein